MTGAGRSSSTERGEQVDQASDDVWEVLATSRSLRRFTDQPVDDATVRTILGVDGVIAVKRLDLS